MSTSTKQQSLTAAEFIKAFNLYAPLSPSADDGQLCALEKSIIGCLPAIAGFVQLVAEYELRSPTLKQSFLAIAVAAQRLTEIESPLSRLLFKARLDASLPARPYESLAEGASATTALVNVAARVVSAVYATVNTYEGAGCAEDDDPVLDGPALTWCSTADDLQALFSRFEFPDPAPLLHEMQVELMTLDRSFSPTVKVKDGDVFGPAVPPQDYELSVPMPQAAQELKEGKGRGKRKAKDESENEPLPLPQQAYPVRIEQKADDPPLRVTFVGSEHQGDAAARIVSLGQEVYGIGDWQPIRLSNAGKRRSTGIHRRPRIKHGQTGCKKWVRTRKEDSRRTSHQI
jgi:hypothetical protein